MAMTLHERSSLAFVALVLAAHGMGFGLFLSPNTTMIMNSVSANARGMASALGAKARSLGMVSGMLITTILISLAQHPIRFIETMVGAFSILAVLTAVALVARFLRSTRRQIDAADSPDASTSG